MPKTNKTYFAVPYYGNIARAGHGFENIFIFASADSKTGKVFKTWVETWKGRTAEDLSIWLAQKNIEGLFADGFSLALEKELNKTSIWTCWGVTGDVHEIAEKHWGKSRVA
jgi:hypothetical protein